MESYVVGRKINKRKNETLRDHLTRSIFKHRSGFVPRPTIRSITMRKWSIFCQCQKIIPTPQRRHLTQWMAEKRNIWISDLGKGNESFHKWMRSWSVCLSLSVWFHRSLQINSCCFKQQHYILFYGWLALLIHYLMDKNWFAYTSLWIPL